MDTYQILTNHRSIREYKKDPIPEKILNRILEAGMRASSSGNMQIVSIIVTSKTAIKNKLYEAHYNQEMVKQAPAVVTFCVDFNRMRHWLDLEKAPQNFDNLISFIDGTVNASIVAQNIVIAAESEGLGVCYMGTTLWSSQKIIEILNLPENVVPITSFTLGYPNENPKKVSRLATSGIVHYDTYHNYTDDDINEIYCDRNQEAWNRYMTYPNMKKLIEEKGIKNSAEIYTKLKYTQEEFIKLSQQLLDTIKNKIFLISNDILDLSLI
ncbi:nitroreductase family protein [Francisella sp. 19X1-34]|uniref:nitroreductase family protein n=1 Tax=Francisella sp. 19X1-34 TaxID=3087177 RepID=UPI002E33E850|nr:nitroreductase family protein [Francisella sp. 19X1-34]MED7788716.1 nitroreductase family protein [Francisella sp. 19X1-34]